MRAAPGERSGFPPFAGDYAYRQHDLGRLATIAKADPGAHLVWGRPHRDNTRLSPSAERVPAKWTSGSPIRTRSNINWRVFRPRNRYPLSRNTRLGAVVIRCAFHTPALERHPRPPHPAPRLVTIAKRPSNGTGLAENIPSLGLVKRTCAVSPKCRRTSIGYSRHKGALLPMFLFSIAS